MAFFKLESIDEFQACVPVSRDFSLNRVSASILSVGLRWVKPLITSALYNDLDAKYNADTLTGDEATAVKLIQQAIANLVFGQDLPLLGSVVDDTGVYVNKSSEKWMLGEMHLAKVEERYWERGLDALEDLLNYLNETANETVFASYYQSPAQAASQELLVPNAEVFNEYYQIWRNALTFNSLRGLLLSTQRGVIKNALADAFASVVNPDSDTKKSLLALVQEAMVYLALAKGVSLRKVKISKDSVTVLMETDQVRGMETPVLNDIVTTAASFEKIGNEKLGEVQDYLEAHADELGYVIPDSAGVALNTKESGLYFL